MSTKKILLYLCSALLIASVVLTACAPAETPVETEEPQEEAPAAPEPTSPPEPAEEVVIEFWHHQDFWKPEVGKGQEMIAAFNDANKGVVQINLTWFTTTDYGSALQTALAADELPDVFANLDLDFIELVANDMLLPVDEVTPEGWAERFVTGSFDEGVNMLDGTIYGWPERAPWYRGTMFYNRDVMRLAGLDPEKPPTTWDELREMSRSVTEAGKGEYYGLVVGGQDDGIRILETLACTEDEFHCAWTANPLQYWDFKDGEYRFSGDGMVKAFELLNAIKNDGSILPGYVNLKKSDARGLFGEGKAAFAFEPQWFINIIKRDWPDVDLGVALAPVPEAGITPYFSNYLAAANYFASGATEHPEMVGRIIDEFLTSEDYFKTFMTEGIAIPAWVEAYDYVDLLPNQEFKDMAAIVGETLRIAPRLSPDMWRALSNFTIIPLPDEMTRNIFAGDEALVEEALAAYNQALEDALEKAIADAIAEGIDVTKDDMIFPDWDPSKNYGD